MLYLLRDLCLWNERSKCKEYSHLATNLNFWLVSILNISLSKRTINNGRTVSSVLSHSYLLLVFCWCQSLCLFTVFIPSTVHGMCTVLIPVSSRSFIWWNRKCRFFNTEWLLLKLSATGVLLGALHIGIYVGGAFVELILHFTYVT